jgi:farnesyl diphosphate synthase
VVKPIDQNHTTISQRMAEAADLVTVALDALLPRADGAESRLVEAMRYAVLGPGRRVRPYFALETARLFDVADRSVLRAACALECLHAYSLIHDDLPALDDDPVRSGRPTVHAAYDEATAVLAGDALHSIAFEIMAHPDTHPEASIRCELVHRLAMAAGAKGLAGGQMLDLLGLGGDLRMVARMQRMKTGSLIGFAVEAPLVLARAQEGERHALLGFAQDFGLAYQIVDDLKDHQRDLRAHRRAKRPEKANFVTLLGREAAGERVDMLSQQCRAHLEVFGSKAAYLRASVDFVLDHAV